MPSKLHILHGDNAFNQDEPNISIIDKVLYKDDIVLLFGSEKAGKSILAQQMAFNLTCAESFLGKYKINAPKKVLYIQTEGKLNEGVERRLRMETTIKCNRQYYAHFYKKFLPLDLDSFRNSVIGAIKTLPWVPEVIFLDALYMGMSGDLINNKEIRKFEENFGVIIEEFGLTGILVHHESKEPIDDDGMVIPRGDKGTYGSVFIRSWVDHIFYLKKRTGRTRTLSCETQRSGKVFSREELLLIGDASRESLDEPLYFEIAEDVGATSQGVLAVVRGRASITKDELKSILNLSDSTLNKSLRSLISTKQILFDKEKGIYTYHEPIKS